MSRPLDVIYIAVSAHDARFARICAASVRHFYPDVPVKLLPGGPLEPGLADEMARYWNVGMADVPPGDYGWGYVKLEPLFGRDGERFLMLDSDTALAGPVLDAWAETTAPFVVDDELQSEEDTRRLYYDWRRLRAIDPAAAPPAFVFNSGQWFGTAGVLAREQFAPWIEGVMPPRLRHPECFMPGDQGVLNYLFNSLSQAGVLDVARRKIMRWPGHGMDGLDAAAIAAKRAPPVVIHWAGMKRASLGEMVGADVLRFFEKLYYARIPGGGRRRLLAGWRHTTGQWRKDLGVTLKLARQRFLARTAPAA